MTRISFLLVIGLLLCGSAAKPHYSAEAQRLYPSCLNFLQVPEFENMQLVNWRKMRQAKVGEHQHQETLKSGEFSRKMSLGMKEVEPPEDMAVTDDNIDPSMAIWKAAQWSRGQKHLVPEVDDDDRNHPSLDKQLEAQANAGPQAPFWKVPAVPSYEQPEPDMDDLFHSFPGSEPQDAEGEMDQEYLRSKPNLVKEEQPRHKVYTQPEEDSDEVYHGDISSQKIHQQPQIQPVPLNLMAHSEPEEDRDHLYHN